MVPTIEALLPAIADGHDLQGAKIAVAALILHQIDVHMPSLGEQQKLHFVNAVGTLCLKGDSGERLTAADLRVSLIDLEKAIAQGQVKAFEMASKHVDMITPEMLRETAATCVRRFSAAEPADQARSTDGPHQYSERYKRRRSYGDARSGQASERRQQSC